MSNQPLCVVCNQKPRRTARADKCTACYWRERRRATGAARPAPVARHHVTWTKQEDDQMLFLIQVYPLATVAARLGRSVEAIRDRLYREYRRSPRGLAQRTHGISAPELADALGITLEHAARLLELGVIPAKRVRALQKAYWSIDPETLTDWLYHGGVTYRLNPNRDWADVAASAREWFEAHYISRQQLVAVLFRSATVIDDWAKRFSFPQPARRRIGQYKRSYYERAAVRAWLEQNPERSTRAAWEAVKDAEPATRQDGRCTISEHGNRCNGAVLARGLCRKHYKRFERYGDPMITNYRRKPC